LFPCPFDTSAKADPSIEQLELYNVTRAIETHQAGAMMNSLKTLLLGLAIVITAAFSTSTFAASAEEAAAEEVIKHVVAFNGAYERNELDAYFAYYAEDATLWFDSGRVKLADYKKDWHKLIKDGGGVVKNVISDLNVQMGPGDTTAVATYQLDVETRMPDGSITKDHAHETDVWFLGSGQWLIAHIHYTVEPPPGAPE
jgi:ketosteroid isomerase-like protein